MSAEQEARHYFNAFADDGKHDRRTWEELDPGKRAAWLRVARLAEGRVAQTQQEREKAAKDATELHEARQRIIFLEREVGRLTRKTTPLDNMLFGETKQITRPTQDGTGLEEFEIRKLMPKQPKPESIHPRVGTAPPTTAAPWGSLPHDAEDPNFGRNCMRCGHPVRAGERALHETCESPKAKAEREIGDLDIDDGC